MFKTFEELHQHYGTYDDEVTRRDMNFVTERQFVLDCFETYEYIGFAETFESPYPDYRHLTGLPFTVLRRTTEVDIDLECLPMWRIRFENGEEHNAFPEEICLAERKKECDNIDTEQAYILTITQEQADIISKACDLYSRIRLGQFERLVDHTLEERLCDGLDVSEFVKRKNDATDLLEDARKVCFPELKQNSSYGIGNDKNAAIAFGVHQVLRHYAGNDDREPLDYWCELPTIRKSDYRK